MAINSTNFNKRQVSFYTTILLFVLLMYFHFRILIMGTAEKLGGNILVDQLMDGIANNCPGLERLELRWDPENLRFSDKSQKAIDTMRVKCLKLKCLALR